MEQVGPEVAYIGINNLDTLKGKIPQLVMGLEWGMENGAE